MSGTSADGVSAVVARFSGKVFEIIASRTDPYPADVAERIRRGGALQASALSSLNMEVGRLFARTAVRVIEQSKVDRGEIVCVGSHGQTVYHGPADSVPNTLQIGDPAVIAAETRVPVVSGFRTGDVTAGGQGAPLIPYFDRFFFGQGAPRALLNIGGIANVAVVGRGVDPLAFDTGPGNTLMDLAMRETSGGVARYDAGGRLAKQGAIQMEAVERMLAHEYFSRKPPKSTGPELFDGDFLDQAFGRAWTSMGPDLLATLNYMTSITIQEAFRSFVFPSYGVEDILVSGGGVNNKTLMKKLVCLFAPIPVRSIAEAGIPPLAKEPLAFAFYGLRRMKNQPNHLPAVTGAERQVLLGSVTKP